MAETAPIPHSRPWLPVAFAIGLGALMLWLAGGPFDPPERFRVEVVTMALKAPAGLQSAFPTRFEWEPVQGAVLYVVGAARATPAGYLTVFRQETEEPAVDLAPDTADPRPGRYAWEVFAIGPGGVPIGRGEGAFEVE